MGSFPPPATPAVDQAFERLARTVLSVAAAAITLSGLDTGNKMFRLTVYNVQDGTAGNVDLRLNNDSGANYDYQDLTGDAATVDAARTTGQTEVRLTTGETVDNGEHSTHEIVIAKQQAGDEAMIVVSSTYIHTTTPAINSEQTGAIWLNTADLISRIDLLNSSNFAADTVALLEGNSTT